MQAIIEAFSTMQEDLSAEKKVMMEQWAKRNMEIERVMASTAGCMENSRGSRGPVWARWRACSYRRCKCVLWAATEWRVVSIGA
jgi:hypothetical protein